MPQLVQRFAVNRIGRTFVVGDIHGCYTQLFALLSAIHFDSDVDVLYSTGDLCDRGPDSRKCLELINQPWFRAVRGNHEEYLIASIHDQDFDWTSWIKRGGAWAANLTRYELTKWVNLAMTLPVVIVIGEGHERFNVFHAEFHGTDKDLDELDSLPKVPWTLQYGRKLIRAKVDLAYHEGFLSPSFVGHTVVKSPRVENNHIYLDTGGYLAERPDSGARGLTMIEPATQKVWQYRSKQGVVEIHL